MLTQAMHIPLNICVFLWATLKFVEPVAMWIMAYVILKYNHFSCFSAEITY